MMNTSAHARESLARRRAKTTARCFSLICYNIIHLVLYILFAFTNFATGRRKKPTGFLVRAATAMRNACIFAVIGLAAATAVGRAAAVEFEPRPQYQQQRQQLYAGGNNGHYSYAGGPSGAASSAGDDGEDYDDAQPSSRIHHGKHKRKLQKKLKKRLLLQCLLEHRRRRRDADGASGRLLLPVVLQSTNVNVAPGGGGYGGGGGGSYGGGSYGGGSYGGTSGCMQFGNNHGPLGSLGSLGPSLGSLGSTLGSFGPAGAPVEEATDEGGDRGSSVDWNRYARRFHRNFVRPLYRLF